MRLLPSGRLLEEMASLKAAWTKYAEKLAPLQYEPDTHLVEGQRFGG
jgi:hypothetical protein